jgi:L-amino acid N-acyltransferase YncA
MSRFAIREARPGDAEGIARAHADSWNASYRGILPDRVLDRVDVGQRVDTRRRLLRDRSRLHLVAYDVTHGDIVGFCDAGPSRRTEGRAGEVYALYLVHHAKRYGLGRDMLARAATWLHAAGMRSLIVWVLDDNHHARRFYEALGGRGAGTCRSSVGGFPVLERSYLWAGRAFEALREARGGP